MKYPLFCVRDVKVGFNNPMTDVSDATAERNFAYAINNNDVMGFASKDYDLYRVGVFDTENGTIEPEVVPVLIVSGDNVYGVNVK